MPTCARCSAENPEAARFCMGCAAPLAEAAGERRERRVVSVLFADLVGFTSRSERIDIEEVGALVSSYQLLLRREVESRGGFVTNFAGDGMMAVFGAPKAHEDDPERAARAGLAICESIAELDEQSPAGARLHVRVGITTGEALISFGGGAHELDAAGDIVNTAARLQTAAPPDGVLVDEATRRATARVIRYEPAEPVAAKGKQEPVVAWLALEPDSRVPEQVREQSALVGREREAELLHGLLARSHGEPSAQLVTLIGPPGIGKTRLVSEFASYLQRLPDSVTWRQGRSLAYGSGIAFWALGEMVKAQAGILESDSAAVAGEKLRDAVDDLIADERDRSWIELQLRPLVGLGVQAVLSAEGGRTEAFAAWRRFLEALAERRPTALLFEDVHWADDALLDFVDLLAERAGALPLLIVCTARPELLERRPAWGGGKTNAMTVGISPLAREDTARLVGQLLDQALLPAELQQALVGRAEGNPLYAQEYVRMLQEQGRLVRDAGGWRLAGDAEGLPESVKGIVAARLDTLAPGDRAFVQDASVLGRTGWLGGVCAIGERSPSEAEESLHQLERAQLVVRSRRSSVTGESEFTFAHALTQEVAYGQIPRGDRAVRHERAARWIEQLAGRREDRAELLAHHYATALELRTRAGQDVEHLRTRAREALIEAGRQAEALTAHATAATHFALALELTAADDPARARLLHDYALTRAHAGTPDEALYQAALEAQVADGEWERAAWMEHVLGLWADYRIGDSERAEQHDACAALHAARVPDRPIAGIVAASRAYRLLVAGRAADALAFVREAESLSQNPEGIALLLCRRGWARLDLGDVAGVDDAREGCRRLAELESPRTALEYSYFAEDLAGLGDFAGAHEACEAASAWAARSGEADAIEWSEIVTAENAYHRGDWDEALRLASTHLVSEEGLNVSFARGVCARIALARGEVPAALVDADEIVAYAESADQEECHSLGQSLRALALEAGGRHEEALAACDAYLARWAGKPLSYRSSDLAAIAPTLVAAGRAGELRAAAASLPAASPIREAIEAVADARHDLASELYEAMGARPAAARTRTAAARQAADGGRVEDAERHAAAALVFYRGVGATRDVAEVEALIDAQAARLRDQTA